MYYKQNDNGFKKFQSLVGENTSLVGYQYGQKYYACLVEYK